MATLKGNRTQKRYVVIGLTGHTVTRSETAKKPATSYSVLDLAYNGIEVFTRYVGTGAALYRLRDCVREAERLNHLDRYS